MKKSDIITVLYFICAAGFLLAYFLGHEIYNLTLGFVWICIGCLKLAQTKKK